MTTSSALNKLLSVTADARQRIACLTQMASDEADDPGAVVVAEIVRDAATSLDGWLAALAAPATRASQSLSHRRFADVAQALCECAEASERALHSYVADLGGVDSLTRLRQLADDQPTAWRTWAWEVQDVVAVTWTEMCAVRAELDRCWQELVEHLLRDPVDVQAHVWSRLHPIPNALVGGQE